MTRILLAFLLVALPSIAPLAAPASPVSSRTPSSRVDGWVMSGLLDPGAPAATRDALWRDLLDEADHGDAWAQYVAGSLYRQGHSHPAQLVERDLDKARTLLHAAALQGSLQAIAKLSEVEIDAGRFAEAMDWAQVFTHYLRERPDFEPHRAGYTAARLKTIYAHLGDTDPEWVRGRVVALLGSVGPSIEAAIQKADVARASETPLLRLPSGKRRAALPRTTAAPDESGLAEFYIAVDAQGRVARYWMLDAVPTPDVADKLDVIVQRMRFNAAPAGDATMRFGMQAVVYDDRRHALEQR